MDIIRTSVKHMDMGESENHIIYSENVLEKHLEKIEMEVRKIDPRT